MKPKWKTSFKPCQDGLYYLDSTKINIAQLLPNQNFNLLSTVQANKEYYSKSEIQGANNACILQEQLAWPGTQTLKSYIKQSLINNNTVTIEDIDRANDIYGPAELTFRKNEENAPYQS